MGNVGNDVPRITNLARRGWHCPRPWRTCWSQCRRRRPRPRAGRFELSGCRWNPWPGWAASRCPFGSTPECKLVTVEGADKHARITLENTRPGVGLQVSICTALHKLQWNVLDFLNHVKQRKREIAWLAVSNCFQSLCQVKLTGCWWSCLMNTYERDQCSTPSGKENTYKRLSWWVLVYVKKRGSVSSVTLLFAVQMKLTVEPTLMVWALGSSTVTSMGLDETSGEMQTQIVQTQLLKHQIDAILHPLSRLW